MKIKESLFQNIKLNDHWTKCVMGFDEVLGNPNVLVAWVGGAGVGKPLTST